MAACISVWFWAVLFFFNTDRMCLSLHHIILVWFLSCVSLSDAVPEVLVSQVVLRRLIFVPRKQSLC